jgi:hypothetical protein
MWRLEAKNASAPASRLRFALCCGDGKFRLPTIPRPPEYLWGLFTSQSEVAADFRTNIRNYNNALNFTSQGA